MLMYIYWYINIQATESGRGKGTGRATRGRATTGRASGIGVPAQSHENVTNTEVIYLIIISLSNNIDML